MGLIYKVINIINNKCYIGQTTKSLNERMISHIKETIYKNNNNYFHNAIKKYGIDNFKWEILCECNSKEELDEMEKYYIGEINTKKPYGYNLTDGGEGIVGYKHTDETKKKISIAESGEKHWNYGKHWSDEIKQKNSDTQKGRKLSDDMKNKISNGLKGKYVGRKMSDETKKKMSIVKQGLYNGKNNPNTKQYKIINILTGEIKIINCLKEWCYDNNLLYDGVRFCVNKRPYKKIYIIEKLNCEGELPK